MAEEHYKDLSAKPFFPDLISYILSGPVVGMVWEGQGVVAAARKIIGATNPLEAEPGTIRGDLAVQVRRPCGGRGATGWAGSAAGGAGHRLAARLKS